MRVGERFGIYEGDANGKRLCRCLSRWGIYQVIPELVEESGSKSGKETEVRESRGSREEVI